MNAKQIARTLTLTALFVSVITTVAVCSVGGGEATIEKIRRAFDAGEISVDEKAVNLFYLITDRSKVDPRFRVSGAVDCATPILIEIREDWAQLRPGTREMLSPVYYRPDNPLSHYYWGAGVKISVLTSTHFKVHYLSDADPENSGNVSACSEMYAQGILVAADVSWTHEISTLGFHAPLVDADYSADYGDDPTLWGGDGRVDFYIYNGFQGWKGVAVPEIPVDPCYDVGFVVLLPYLYEGGWPATSHEFFHLVQFYYDYDLYPNWFWLESTAEWMADEVFHDLNDRIIQRVNNFLATPETPLDTGGTHEYEACIWPIFLETYIGSDVIKGIVEEGSPRGGGAGVCGDDTWPAHERALGSRSHGLVESFGNFVTKNYNQQFYPDGDRYNDVHIEQTFVLGSSNQSIGEQTVYIDHLASRYFKFVGEATLPDNTPLRVKVSGLPDGDKIAAAVVKNGATFTEYELTAGTVRVEHFEDVDEVVLVLANASIAQDNTQFNYMAYVNQVPVADAGPDQGVGVGDLVQVSGSAFDPDTTFTFEWFWTMRSRPAGSTAALSDSMSQTVTFAADRPGAYVICLDVSDGMGWSAPDTVIVTADRTLWRVPVDAPTIQAAIDLATSGDTVEVASGTYTGVGNRDIRFRGKVIRVRSATGDPGDCTVDCEGSLGDEHRGFIFEENEGSTSVLEGFTIMGGYEVGGAGILVRGAGPLIRDCVLSGNEAGDAAGLQVMDSSTVWVGGCRFEGNTATTYGGGAGVSNLSTVTFERCAFIGNSSDFAGGGVSTHTSSATFDSCLFVGNESPNGGALALNHAGWDLELRRCTLYGNSATQGGGILAANSASVVVENTIMANGATGAAVACIPGSSVSLSCSDLYGNAGGNYVGCVSGQLGVNGNISADPLFCDVEAEDFGLDESSPCAPDHAPSGCGLIGAFGVNCTLVAIGEKPAAVPTAFYLGPAIPNPFNPTTRIHYDLASHVHVLLSVYDVSGRLIRRLVDEVTGPGTFAAEWDGTNDNSEQVSTGIYFCQLTAGSFVETRKMVRLK